MFNPSLLVAAALHLARLGFAVHWLWPRSKVPRHENWQQLGPDAYAPSALWASYNGSYNVGIRTGLTPCRVSVIVLDIDDESARTYALERVPLSPLRVLTRRGEQWYYRHPGPGLSVATRAKIDGHHLDLRGDGGQVVCPPSIHPSGHRYSWHTPPTVALLDDLPLWSPSWFPLPIAPTAPPKSRPTAASEGRVLRRAIARAKLWPIAEDGKGRGTQTFLLAGILRNELGLDEATAYGVLAEYYNPRLPQPYDEQRLRRKVAEGGRATRAQVPVHVFTPGARWNGR